jgi:hypothetical protein
VLRREASRQTTLSHFRFSSGLYLPDHTCYDFFGILNHGDQSRSRHEKVFVIAVIHKRGFVDFVAIYVSRLPLSSRWMPAFRASTSSWIRSNDTGPDLKSIPKRFWYSSVTDPNQPLVFVTTWLTRVCFIQIGFRAAKRDNGRKRLPVKSCATFARINARSAAPPSSTYIGNRRSKFFLLNSRN